MSLGADAAGTGVLTAALLYDGAAATGAPDARDTLIELRHVGQALEQHGYRSVALPVDLDLGRLERALRELAPAVAFNLVESIEGRGGLIAVVPALLESVGVPFTGCGAVAQALTSDKRAAKRHMRAAGLPVPAIYSGRGDTGGPWILKSVSEHSSLGLDDASVVAACEAVPSELARRRAAYGGDWFAERYIEGRELNVAMIESRAGVQVLPVAEIEFVNFPAGKPRIVGYAAKWQPDSPEYRQTTREFVEDPDLCAHAAALARRCWELFDLAGYARVDLRVDASGEPWVLEVNANPCLSPDAGFCAALAQAEIGFETAIGWLLSAAAARRAQGGASAPEWTDVQHS